MMAVQPTSCSTFSAAKKMPPFPPKLILTVSMALLPVRPPMSPAANIMTQPITCPRTIASIPFAMPSGAK